MATTAKTKKPASKATATRRTVAKAKTPAKRPAAPTKAVSAARRSTEAVPALEMRAILLVTLFVALCILFVQVYLRSS